VGGGFRGDDRSPLETGQRKVRDARTRVKSRPLQACRTYLPIGVSRPGIPRGVEPGAIASTHLDLDETAFADPY
jgi:hypothetical protein